MFDEVVEPLLARCSFPPAGHPIDCAVSGGPDSCALLVLAVAAGCRVHAHHVDHGLRDGSDAEAEIVAALAARFDADFTGHRAHVAPGPNLEARARASRFAVLPAGVATGHTLDDRAETMLINLLRGAGRAGLSPLPGSTRHPIVALRRRETTQLCDRLGITPVRDPSNADPAHLRNRIRAEVMPLLDEVAGRDVAPVFARQADILEAEDELLDALASEIDASDARALAAAPPALARRAVRLFVAASWNREHPPSAQSVERVLAVARGETTACEIEGGHRVHRHRQRLTVEPSSLA